MITNINIMGSRWKVVLTSPEQDSRLKDVWGYCDWTIRTIVVCAERDEDTNLIDFEKLVNKVMRHEIIHAFMYESGLMENEVLDNDQRVDWLAYQYPKIKKVFETLGIDK